MNMSSTGAADLCAALVPGVRGGTHRRRATVDRCHVRVVVLRMVVCGVVLVVCLCVCVDLMMIFLTPHCTPPIQLTRHGPQRTQHTASTAATPR